jgi:hypothetical protein
METTLPPFIPRKPIKYKPRVRPAAATAPPLQTLMLVSASYDEGSLTLFLTFDRAVDASALIAAQVIVVDGTFNATRFGGVGAATVISPTQISIALEWVDDAPLGPVTLSASALTGITAVDDGGTWAGVSDVGLPYDG